METETGATARTVAAGTACAVTAASAGASILLHGSIFDHKRRGHCPRLDDVTAAVTI